MDKLIRTFLEISRSGSLTAAADRLHITQPSLTKRLQQLEQAYGSPLFERGVSGAKHTECGRILLEYAERIEAEFRQSREAVDAANAKRLDVLRIGAGPLFHLRYLSEPILSTRRAFPETRVELTTSLFRECLEELQGFRMDIAFGAHEAQVLPSNFTFMRMTDVEQGVALREDHPLIREKRLEAGMLSELDWVIYGKRREDVGLLDSYFERSGIAPPMPHLLTTSFTTGLKVVAESDAAMMAPMSIAAAIKVPGITVRRTEPSIAKTPAGAFLRRSTLQYPVAQHLIEEVKSGIAASSAASH